MEQVAFVTEPLLSPEFVAFDAVVPLLERLRTFSEVAVAAPSISLDARRALEDRGIRPLNGGGAFPSLRHPRDELPSYIWSWGRDAFLGQNARSMDRVLKEYGGLRVNYSMTTACHADCWYIQSGPLGPALETMRTNFNPWLRDLATLSTRTIGAVDWTHAWRTARRSRRIYSSTEHVGQFFANRSVKVRGVLPGAYRRVFRPSTSSPTRDFVLAYLGKETDAEALLRISQQGIPLKIFGSKSAGWVNGAFKGSLPSHVQILGRIEDEELRDLYTNALFTAFPFTEEPFGLVPIESMACGTPVLSYRRQGPAETILDGETGWLVDTRDQFVAEAERLYKNGYAATVPGQCLRRATQFHIDAVVQQWEGMLRAAIEGSEEPAFIPRLRTVRPGLPAVRPTAVSPRPAPIWVEPFGSPSLLDSPTGSLSGAPAGPKPGPRGPATVDPEVHPSPADHFARDLMHKGADRGEP